MLELWGMQSTPSLPSLPGSLWPGVVAPDKSMGQIELFDIQTLCKQMKMELFEIELFDHLTVCIKLEYLIPYNCVIIICIRNNYFEL